MDTIRKVVVFGAAGRTGSWVVKAALERGLEVTAFVRSAEKLSRAPGLTACQGDVTDARRVEEAVAGKQAVLVALGPTKGAPANLMSAAAKNIVAAMRLAHVDRVVALSGAAVQFPGDPPQPLLVRAMAGAFGLVMGKAMANDTTEYARTLAADDLAWTIVRPMRLVDGAKRGGVKSGVDLRLGLGASITRADLGEFMVAELERDDHVRRAPMVTQ